jgi:hypothetical protein
MIGILEPSTAGGFIGSLAVGLGVALGTWSSIIHRARKRTDALLDAVRHTMRSLAELPTRSRESLTPEQTPQPDLMTMEAHETAPSGGMRSPHAPACGSGPSGNQRDRTVAPQAIMCALPRTREWEMAICGNG